MADGEWPVEIRSVTESLVTTLGPNDLWNVAALGLHPPEAGDSSPEAGDPSPDSAGSSPERADQSESPVTARTWGNTRTRRNFHRQGEGYVQFTRDPVDFVDATLSIYEVEEPVLDSADAWVEVEAEQIDAGESGGTQFEEWELRPCEASIERETVPTINRGFDAVVEATVAASRLGVDAYEQDSLRERLAYFEEVGETCGDERVHRALERLRTHLDE